jgi:WD40 repeat protein
MNISEINDAQKEENEKYKNKPQIAYTNSIEFISEMEKIYIKNKNLKENKIYQLNNYNNNNSKDYIKVINSIPKTSLSSLIFKQGIIITSMTVKKNNIYIGTNKGETRVYNWKTEKKLNYLINSEIARESKKDVICMDASDDNKVLVVGHLNGYILLWDIENSECKKLIQGEFNTQIVAIKFSLIEKGFYEFLASDLKGSVKRLGVNEGFFLIVLTVIML